MGGPIILIAVVTLIGMASSSAASLYIGDVADAGPNIPAGTIGPDTANAGAVTYAFFSAGDVYTNNSGGSQLLRVTEANFFSATTGTLTPFVAVLTGGGAAGTDYNVLAKGDGIAGLAGLNNASFLVAGLNPVIPLSNGETLVAGFHQTGGNPNGMIPWLEAGTDPDYLSDFGGVNGGDNIPASGPLGDNANWSTLGREYRFNVGLDVIPEPSIPIFLLIPAVMLAGFGRRRRKS